MAVRKIVRIDEELCNGCGDCVPSCHEGAIRIVDGKARLVGDTLCDGLGDCLGACPQGAIAIEEREADDFDERAVAEHLAARTETGEGGRTEPSPASPCAGGCPGAAMRDLTAEFKAAASAARSEETGGNAPAGSVAPSPTPSTLRQWPVQLHLLSPTAPFLRDADLLLAADCTAYALGGFHGEHLKGRSLAIACPKLDRGLDIYLEKLVGMIEQGGIRSLTILIMEVPCCGGLSRLAREALDRASREIPAILQIVGVHGDILDTRDV